MNLGPVEHFGRFLESGGYEIMRRHLPRRWDFLLAAPALVARFSQSGLVSLQLQPPAGRFLCESVADCAVPPLVLWINDGEGAPFTHVWSPVSPEMLSEPARYSAIYEGEEVRYALEVRGWSIQTTFRLAPGRGALLGEFSVKNTCSMRRKLRCVLAVATTNAPAVRVPWDPVGLYQRAEIFRSSQTGGILVENRHAGGNAAKRRNMGVFVSRADAEIIADRSVFCGSGSWALPSFVLRKTASKPLETVHGIDTVAAFSFGDNVVANAKLEFRFAVAPVEGTRYGVFKNDSVHLLGDELWNAAAEDMAKRQALWEGALEMKSPDEMLNDYSRVWIPRQLQWVAMLDRGWASGLRGVRDAAQDFSAVAWFDPSWAREVLLLLLANQRGDGWFPRQIALPGSGAAPDLRDYVDSGCWVVELIWDYLRLTGDEGILEVKLPWLESSKTSPVSEHLERAVEYYLNPANRGTHGLVLIRGGDWNDAIHTAGTGGRGETVMASCQAVLAMRQAAEILSERNPQTGHRWLLGAEELTKNLRASALNTRGFLNGVCTDDGRWIFSDRDPDGRERLNTAVQAWGILADVFEPDEARHVLAMIRESRGPHGFRLFHPPLGAPPIDGVGRVASGDLMAGVAENGTVYNHGSQAFLARAAAHTGDGEFLLEILRWALPCHPETHPLATAKTPPYAIVNCWMETPGHDGEGGGLFLSGTVGVLWRVVVEGLLGFQPRRDGIHIRPCLPDSWDGCAYAIALRGQRHEVGLMRKSVATPTFIPWAGGRP